MAGLSNVYSAILAFAKLQLIDARYKKNVSAHGRSAQRNYFCPKLKSLKKYLLLFFCITALNTGQAQSPNDSTKYLLLDMALQLQITDAIDDMYNFDFHKAEVEFNWMRYNYPEHPLPYFLFGISTWWQMMPNLDKETPLGDEFLAYMDQAIEKAENMLDVNEDNMEAEFFLAGAYGFVGRYHSEKHNWGKATNAGRLALKYLNEIRGNEDFSPEILFGDGLFNYYSVYIKETYPLLRPVLAFFPKGDKELGIEQLEKVTTNAFYTRMEAIYFLMRIKAFDMNETFEALRLSEYIYEKYPNNPYFHRFYARMLYSAGQYKEAASVSQEILNRVVAKQTGYEEISGRYAAFFLAHDYRSSNNWPAAERYYQMVIDYTENINDSESGYYLYSQLYLAEREIERAEYEPALERIDIIRDNTKRKESLNERARELKKEVRRKR